MLYRMKKSDDPFPTAAVLAGSTIAGIFEDFLARDQVRHLGPVLTFYLLVASIAFLPCYRYHDIWPEVQQDLTVIGHAQEQMKKKWPSAIGSIRSYEKMFTVTTSMQERLETLPPQRFDPTAQALLKGADGSNCRLYNAIKVVDDPVLSGQLSDLQNSFSVASNSNGGAQNMFDQTESRTNLESTDWMNVDQMDSWLLDDSLFGGHLSWDDVQPHVP